MVVLQVSEVQVALKLTIKNLGEGDQAYLSMELFYPKKI